MSFQDVYNKVVSEKEVPQKEDNALGIPKDVYESLSLEGKIRIHLVSTGYFEGDTWVPFPDAKVPESEADLKHSVYFTSSTVLLGESAKVLNELSKEDPRNRSLRGFPDDHYLFRMEAVTNTDAIPECAGINPKYSLSKYPSILIPDAGLPVTTFSDPVILGNSKILLTNGKRLVCYTADRKNYWLDEAREDLPADFDIETDVDDSLLTSRFGSFDHKWVVRGERISDQEIEKFLNE